MNRIVRNIVFWSLFGIGLIIVAISGIAIALDFTELGTNIILFGGAFTFAAIALLSVFIGVIVMGAISNPKTLIKLVVGIVGIAAVILMAWLMTKPWLVPVPPLDANGDPLEVTNGMLVLTEVMINLTWILLGGTGAALVTYLIIGAIRK